MREFQDVFTIKLKCLSPVFVGSGREINKKEYLYINSSEIGVLDFERFYAFIRQRRMGDSFDDFLMNDSKGRLFEWIKKNRIDIKEVKPYIKYSLSCKDTSLERGTKIQIMEFSRDPYGELYIPGSSLKGMLRTILMYSKMAGSPDDYTSIRNDMERAIRFSRERSNGRADRNLLSREEKAAEVKAFFTLNRDNKGKNNNDARNDIFAGLLVGDSKPIEASHLILAQKIDRGTNGEENRLNLLRESLKPGTEMEFPIVIDQSICPLSREDIISAINTFVSVYNNSFVKKFKGIKLIPEDTIVLGGGSGFVSKTINYVLWGEENGTRINKDIFDRTGVPIKHRHNEDMVKGVSPHMIKCTSYNGELCQMGLCKIMLFDTIG